MTLKELKELLAISDTSNKSISDIIAKLKSRPDALDLKTFREQYSPNGHDTMSKVKRPDKAIKKPQLSPTKDDPNRMVDIDAVEKVNRLALPMQKIIVKRAVSFLFGNPVKINSEAKKEQEKQVLNALNRILKDCKINSFNRRIAKDLFRSTEIAECWYPVEKPDNHSTYGFDTKFKIRVMAFSPWDGNELYPLFDDTGDMIAFSRAYTRIEEGSKETKFFETYTDDEKIIWVSRNSQWEQLERIANAIKKIPVIYGKQDEVEWADVQTCIERLEYLLSNFADTNDYHASPKIFVEGKLEGFSKKGESGAILQGTAGTKAYYLSWDHATDAVKLEIETLLRFIYTFTQTPDISFDSVKGLREISGEALKMLFLDAHLKVQEKREVFDEYLERRTNVIKAYLGYVNTSLKTFAYNMDIESEVQPFIINDVAATIKQLTEATAGKAILSQRTAVAQSGLVDNVDQEMQYLQDERDQAAERDVFERTV